MACAACGGIHLSGEECMEDQDQEASPDLVDDEFNDSKEKFIEEDEEDEEWGDEDDDDDDDLDDDEDEEEDDEDEE